jgi:hypothetical protein
MIKKYLVEIKGISLWKIEVEAESKDEAKQKAQDESIEESPNDYYTESARILSEKE